jgi:ferredoxin-NADP reductase
MITAIGWRIATVTDIRDETPSVRSFRLRAPDWPGHRPGQHIDLRLTAADGYSVQRSYSIASAPADAGGVEITVERIADGEISPFLHDTVVVGDRLELRGPIGGYFVWEPSIGGPLLLVAGGSGVVPLMSMIRQRQAAGSTVPTRLLLSSRHYEEIIYRDELDRVAGRDDGIKVLHTLTRSQPPDWGGYTRRIDDSMLGEVLQPLGVGARVYVCGPSALVETAANALVRLGLPPANVRTERFGPTGT